MAGVRTESRLTEAEGSEDNVVWMRVATLDTLIVALLGASWLGMAMHLWAPMRFWPGWGEWLAVLLVTVVCFAVRRQSYHLASDLLIAGLSVIVTRHTLGNVREMQIAPYLFVSVVLVAGTLRNARAAFIVASYVTALLVAISVVLGTGELTPAVMLQIAAVIWLAVLTSWLTTRSLHTILDWLWQSQQESRAHLDEVQRRQGELAAALKQLSDATYRLEQLNHALVRARLEADEARRLKAQFAAQVSHELRTPINLVVGFSDLMLNNPQAYGGAELPAQYQVDLQTLSRSAKHLQGLIDDILDLSQLDVREMPVLREVVDAKALVGEAVEAIRQLLDRKNLSIAVDFQPDVGSVYVDPLRIRQVLLNLLSNAARHTDAGGITIRVGTQEDHLVIAVSDTGEGIDPREIPHLFEPFYRQRSRSRSTGEGSGLGLAICKQFVELHGGTISAESDGVVGHGSTFTVKLPLWIRPIDDPAGKPARIRVVNRLRTQQVTSPPQVVLVDADPYLVNLHRRHLTNYDVVTAANEGEALGLVRALKPHAAIVHLPKEGEYATWYQRWASVAAQYGLRIVACPMVGSRERARTIGLVDFLVKPVTRETLLTTIRRANPDARTIAIIDDDRAMVRLLDRMLRTSETPFRILRAYDGEDGLDLVRRVRPDLVLLDLVMPRVGGLSFLELLRQDPELADLAVVAVSAKGATEVLPAPDGRQIGLITDRSLTVTELIRGIRALLDSLPPTATARTGSAARPGGVRLAEPVFE